MNADRGFGLVGGACGGPALGFDLSCKGQGTLGQGRADQLIHQHAEEDHIANQTAIGQGCGGDCHTQGHTGLGQQGDAQVLGNITK